MLFSKKLVTSVFIFWELFTFTKAQAQNNFQGSWVSDQEVLVPSSGGINGASDCDRYPDLTMKIIEQLEHKNLCQSGRITSEECSSLFLKQATGASIGALAALSLSKARISPEDIICSDSPTSSNESPWSSSSLFSSLTYPKILVHYFLIPEVFASYCHIRARGPMVKEATRLSQFIADERENTINKFFQKAQLEPSGMNQVQAREKLGEHVSKFILKIENAVKEKKVSEALGSTIIKDANASFKEGRFLGLVQKMENACKQALKVDLDTCGVDKDLLTKMGKILREGSISNEQANDRARILQSFKSLLEDASFGDDHVREQLAKFSASYPNLIDVDSLMRERFRIISMVKLESRIRDSVTRFQYGKDDIGKKIRTSSFNEEQFFKSIMSLDYGPFRENQEVMRTLSNLGDLSHGHTLSISAFSDLTRALTNLGLKVPARKIGTGILAGAGKVALAAVADPVALATFTGMPINCEKNFATMDRRSSKVTESLGFRYLNLDAENCKPQLSSLAEDGKFNDFLQLHPHDRLKMARGNSLLCGVIYKYAEKNLLGDKYRIQCESPTSFTLSEVAKKTQGNFRNRETVSLSEAERLEYQKIGGVRDFSHSIHFSGDSYKVNFQNNRALPRSCSEFSVNIVSQKSSESRPACTLYTKKVLENNFDYAQIQKCCSGQQSSYCDIFSKNFSDSSLNKRENGSQNFRQRSTK